LTDFSQPLRCLRLLRPCPSLLTFRAGTGPMPAPVQGSGPPGSPEPARPETGKVTVAVTRGRDHRPSALPPGPRPFITTPRSKQGPGYGGVSGPMGPDPALFPPGKASRLCVKPAHWRAVSRPPVYPTFSSTPPLARVRSLHTRKTTTTGRRDRRGRGEGGGGRGPVAVQGFE
jgi:hypothetical protein